MTAGNQPAAPPSLPKYIAKGLPKQDTDTLWDVIEYAEQLIEYMERPVEPEDLPNDATVADTNDGKRGIIVEQYRTCGDSSCQCMKGGKKHGPYEYLYHRMDDGTLKCEYVGKPQALPTKR